MTEQNYTPNYVETVVRGESYRGICGACGAPSRKYRSERKALAAIGDHRVDAHRPV